MKDNRLYLSNIKECIERIECYTHGGHETFMETPMIQDAVIRNFEVIGEAAKRLSCEIRASYPGIQWQQIASLRDALIHDNLRVNLNRVWGMVERNLPELKVTVEIILQDVD